MPKNDVITDVGSVKKPVLEIWKKLHPRFVGSHPMAGTILTGVEAGVIFIQSSMPSAVLTYLIAEIYSPKKTVNSIASTVVLSTFLSFISVPIVVFLSLKYFY